MDRDRFSSIAHRQHVYWSPIEPLKMDRLLSLVELGPSDSVLELGSGAGELLVRLHERTGAAVVAVDRSTYAFDELRRRFQTRAPTASLTIHQGSIESYEGTPSCFGLVACIGALSIDSRSAMLQQLAEWTRPGGYVLIGELYWRQPPDPAFLEAMGLARESYGSHADNERMLRNVGLTSLYSFVASQDDWDHYEGLYLANVEQYAAAYPDDPDVPAMLARARGWREVVLQWGAIRWASASTSLASRLSA